MARATCEHRDGEGIVAQLFNDECGQPATYRVWYWYPDAFAPGSTSVIHPAGWRKADLLCRNHAEAAARKWTEYCGNPAVALPTNRRPV